MTTVALADDSVLFRQGVARLLTDAGFDVVGEAGDVPGLIDVVGRSDPDIVIVDVRMPPGFATEGLQAAAELRADKPGRPVLVLSQYVEPHYAMRLLADRAGGLGYLLKDRVADADALIEAVARVAAGGTVVDPDVVAEILGVASRRDPLESLTVRERDVLELMAQGRSNQAIGGGLFLTDKTVERTSAASSSSSTCRSRRTTTAGCWQC